MEHFVFEQISPVAEGNRFLTHWICCNLCHLPPTKEEVHVFAHVCLFVCLSVCLSVSNITQKRVHGFG